MEYDIVISDSRETPDPTRGNILTLIGLNSDLSL